MKSNTPLKHSLACALIFYACSALCEPNHLLSEVYVYGTGFQESIENSLPQTEIITSSSIRNSGLTNVGDVLQKLGNINTRTDLSGNLNSSIDIRGYGATSDNNVLVLLDGVRLSENQQSAARIWTVPVELIDHIEIVRGSSSVLYGESATSGVINIITNKQKADLGVVSASVGSFGTYQSSAYASKNINNLQISAYEKSQNSQGYRDQNSSQNRTGGVNLDYNVTTNVFAGIKLSTDTNNSLLSGGLSQAQFALNPTQAQYNLSTLLAANTFNNKNDLASSYLKIIDGKVEYLADVFKRTYSINAVNSQPAGVAYNPITGDSTDPYAYTSSFNGFQDGYSFKAKIGDFLLTGNSMTIGVDGSSWLRDGGANDQQSIDSVHATQKGGGGFIQDDFRVTEIDKISIGFRKELFTKIYNDQTNTGSSQNGKINLNAYELQYSRSLSNSVSSYAKAAQSYRIANVDDLYGSFCAGFLGNHNCLNNTLSLLPQINKDFELGVIQSTATNKSTFKIYRSNIQNEIILDATTLSNVNASKTFRQGIELADQYKSNNYLTVKASLNFVQAKFLTDSLTNTSDNIYDKSVSGTPNYTFSGGIDVAIDQNQTIGFMERVVGAQYAQGDNTNLIKLGSYPVADMSYRYSMKQWLFTANLNNVFDRKYFDTAIFGQNIASPHYNVYPNPGRNISLLGRYSF